MPAPINARPPAPRAIRRLVLAGLFLSLAGCGGEPSAREVANARAFEALLTAVSLKNEKELDQDARVIDARHAAGELSEGPYQEIREIIEKARAKDWQGAEKRAYEFRAGSATRARTSSRLTCGCRRSSCRPPGEATFVAVRPVQMSVNDPCVTRVGREEEVDDRARFILDVGRGRRARQARERDGGDQGVVDIVSRMNAAEPVPRDEFGGVSCRPVRFAVRGIKAA